MTLLLVGLTIFCGVHLFKAGAPGARDQLVARLGENPYKGIFSLLILAGLVMIVFGWKAAVPAAVYSPPLQAGALSSGLVFIALVLFFASQMAGHIKRVLRHPQMIGTLLWAVTHLLTNGDSRSLALFGGLALWATLEIVLCNRRDGPRKDRPDASARADLVAIIVGGVAFALLGHFHLKLFGVPPLPV